MVDVKLILVLFALSAFLVSPLEIAHAGVSDIVFMGCVISVGNSPGIFSGVMTTFQTVEYEIKAVVSGGTPSSPITVHHTIVDGKSDVGPINPELNPGIVFPGAALLVTATPTNNPNLGFINTAFDSVMPDSSIVCDGAPPPPVVPVGGKLISLDVTNLLLAGAQSFSWMIPVVLSGIGIGLFVVSRKS